MAPIDSDNTTWTGTFTPKDNDSMPSSQSSSYNMRFELDYDKYNDFKGNEGHYANNAAQTKYSEYFIADTKDPYVTSLELVHDGEEVTTTDGICMPTESNIKVNFDYIMNPYTITTTKSVLSTTNCAGSVNLSSDNFSTCGASCSCVGMTPPNEPSTPSNSYKNREYTLNPTDNLSSSTSYKVKVTTDAKDVLANPVASDYIHSHELKSSAILPASDSEVFFGVGEY